MRHSHANVLWRLCMIIRQYMFVHHCLEILIKNAALTHKSTFQVGHAPFVPGCRMLSFARKLISYAKQVSWLTDTNVCPPLLTCIMIGLCNGILKTDSPNTVTGSLRTYTWFPFRIKLVDTHLTQHSLHILILYHSVHTVKHQPSFFVHFYIL